MGGWALVALVVVVWDMVAPRRGRHTMSRAYWDTRDSQLRDAVAFGVTCAVLRHLLNPPPPGTGKL